MNLCLLLNGSMEYYQFIYYRELFFWIKEMNSYNKQCKGHNHRY